MATLPNQTKSLGSSVRDAKNQKKALSHQAVEKAAYNIWIAEGQKPGCDQKNWFEAEKRLSAA